MKICNILLTLFLLFSLPSCSKSKQSSELSSRSMPAKSSDSRGELISEGKRLAYAYACMNCHKIPDLIGVPGTVGPPLSNWKNQQFIVGTVPNTFENLSSWLQKPHQIDKDTTMPKLNINEEQARAISAFLFSLEED